MSEVQKTQAIRLADVFLIGPLMLIGGNELARRRPLLGALLVFLGGSTIGFNGANYMEQRRRLNA